MTENWRRMFRSETRVRRIFSVPLRVTWRLAEFFSHSKGFLDTERVKKVALVETVEDANEQHETSWTHGHVTSLRDFFCNYNLSLNCWVSSSANLWGSPRSLLFLLIIIGSIHKFLRFCTLARTKTCFPSLRLVNSHHHHLTIILNTSFGAEINDI